MNPIIANIIVIAALSFGGQLLFASAKSEPAAPKVETVCLDNNKAWDGMFFSSEYVTEEYEYDDVYCLLYDDADANMSEVEICVDLKTYKLVMDAVKTGKPLVGKLVLKADSATVEFPVFTYAPEPEFEMAEASAKRQ